MNYRVAAVSFLNTVPLIDWFDSREAPRVALTRALPSRLAPQLAAGEADAGLVPTVEILRGRGGGILSPTGIACDGPVDSVALFAGGPLPGLKRVIADRGSRTSVALLRILLAERHGISPEFEEAEPRADRPLAPDEAMLVIGDRCLARHALLRAHNPDGQTTHDLGELWRDLTGLPFVFAAWASSPRFAAEAAPEDLLGLGDLLTRARDHGLRHLDELAAREAAAGKLGHRGEATAAAIAYYFRTSLRFSLGEREFAGMRRFQELCVRHGLAPDAPFPTLHFRS